MRMFSRFHNKFREDLELIYAKYSIPFDGAPELTLSTCDLPENVQIIENYSNCGKYKFSEDDRSTDETSDEENQSSCYDSDEQNSSSESFQLEKSFRDKYPRSCAKKESTEVKNRLHNENKSNSAVQRHYSEHVDKQTRSNMRLARHYSSDEYLKPQQQTVTVPKDLWSQVQHCLRLMTCVFSQLDNECDIENNLENESSAQREQCLLKKFSVKQKLFDDDNISCDPPGQVMEKLFIRQKESSGPGIELASKKTYIHRTASKMSENERLDSGFCHENLSDVDASNREIISTSSSCRSTMTISESSEGSCSESLHQKPRFANSIMKSAGSSQQLSSDDNANCDSSYFEMNPKFTSPKIFGQLSQALPEKRRRRRYRFVRRQSVPCKTQGKSTSDVTEIECSIPESNATRSEHSLDQCLSDSDDFNIPEKTVKKTVNYNKQDERSSSPEMHDVIFVAPPSTPVIQKNVECPRALPKIDTPVFNRSCLQGEICSSTPRKITVNKTPVLTVSNKQEHCRFSTPRKITVNKTPVLTVSNKQGHCCSYTPRKITVNKTPVLTVSNKQGHCCSYTPRKITVNKTPVLTVSNKQGHCRSSTPRKQPGVNHKATTDRGECEKQSVQHSNTSADSMFSTIRSTSSYNKRLHEPSSSVSCPKSQSPKDQLLLSPISAESPSSILHPEITVNFLKPKEMIKRKKSSVGNERRSEKHNIPLKQNRHGCSSNPPKFEAEQDCLSNICRNTQPRHLLSTGSSEWSSTWRPEVICRTTAFSELNERSKTEPEHGTDRRRANSSKSHSIDKPTMIESDISHRERKTETITSKDRQKFQRYSSSPPNHPRTSKVRISPRPAKFHPYATYNKFPRTPSLTSAFQSSSVRTPSLISPLRDLSIKSPSSSRYKWTTLDRSPMAMYVKQARRISNPVVASRKILEFGSHHSCSSSSDNEKTLPGARNESGSRETRKKLATNIKTDPLDEEDDDDDPRLNCSNGKCTKTFCFYCSNDLS